MAFDLADDQVYEELTPLRITLVLSLCWHVSAADGDRMLCLAGQSLLLIGLHHRRLQSHTVAHKAMMRLCDLKM